MRTGLSNHQPLEVLARMPRTRTQRGRGAIGRSFARARREEWRGDAARDSGQRDAVKSPFFSDRSTMTLLNRASAAAAAVSPTHETAKNALRFHTTRGRSVRAKKGLRGEGEAAKIIMHVAAVGKDRILVRTEQSSLYTMCFCDRAYLVFRPISGRGRSGCPIGKFAFDEGGGGPFRRSDRTKVTLLGHSRDR